MGRKRDVIIRKGKELFLTQGIAATSMDQIAEAVPVSKMTLYNIFGNKEGLLSAVADALIAQSLAAFDAAAREAANPLDALNRLAAVKTFEDMTGVFLQDLQAYPELMKRLIDDTSSTVMPRFEAIILEGQQQGYIRKDLSPIVIVSFLNAMKQYMAQSELLQGAGSLQTIGEQVITIFYHGIVAERPTKNPDGT